MIYIVTPSLAFGESPTPTFFQKAGSVDKALMIIRGGGRALVPDEEIAREVLVLLGNPDPERAVETALEANPQESVF